ncbi:MAG TPA: helix-turn-helix domain-containing protein [Mycobacteriales bacterium]|nr:helix-turn-helix domain-containing protein [Mycobacteriales bacterium]
MTLPPIERNRRMSDAERAAISAELLMRYTSGRSIREICDETGYSIGRVRRLLENAGAEFRPRGRRVIGGPRRR